MCVRAHVCARGACVLVWLCVHVFVLGGEEWISTGLYLSPGMKTYISVPSQIVNKGWQVQYSAQL